MTDRPSSHAGEEEQTSYLAPENDNSEQDDADTQAQTVADQAMGRSSDDFGLTDTVKPKGGIEDDDDTQDIVDHMNQMVTSGRIDMSAFRGEPSFDDEEDRYGAAAEEDDVLTGKDKDLELGEDEEGLAEGEDGRIELGLDEVDADELAIEDDEGADDEE